MLKLRRVDIQGFKSFYDRTEMRFQGSGIAAIVGPNGCGKSNISDAISWVLGEQSAKSLRGTRMEDVIFAGTRERKPLGMAHSHPDHGGSGGGCGKHAAHSRWQRQWERQRTQWSMGRGWRAHKHEAHHRPVKRSLITRRLYRSGESDYLIDGHTARLRDIQELFSGTGLGPESYAIIEQGRIGQILSNKPADRRAIIEEAAGIGKYKTKKRLAEAKLESARQNLSRVFDILEEVSCTGEFAGSAQCVRAKAKRYGRTGAHRRWWRIFRQACRRGWFQVLEREAAKLALDLNQAHSAFQGFSAQVQEQEREHTTTQEACYRTETELTTARGRVAQLNLEAERTRGRLELQAKQIGSIDDRLAAGETETQDLESRQQREQAELEVHAQALAQLEADSIAAREQLQAKTAERDGLQNNLRERERGIEAARQLVLKLLGEASNLRNQLAQIDEYLAATERDSTRSRKEEESASADLAQKLETVEGGTFRTKP